MIALDATPWAEQPRRGAGRAVDGWLDGLGKLSDAPPVVLFAPMPFPCGITFHHGASVTGPADDLAFAPTRGFRRALSRLLDRFPATVFLSPWSAFPRTHLPVVVTVHELPFVRHGPIEGRWRARKHRWWLARDVARAAAIVVPSTATRDDLLALHPEAAPRVHVVPHGFDPARYERARAATASAPATPGRAYGVIVGATTKRKGLATWLEARRATADLPLDWVLVGEPERGLRRAVRRYSGVRVEPALQDDALEALLAGAHLLVYPSLSEGFGFPPLEAMAAGIPVIATTAGSIPEVTGDAALLVPPADVAALATATRRVATDAALRADLVTRGTVRARAFPTPACARALLDVLRSVEGRRP